MNIDLLNSIEKALDIKLYEWQRKYLLEEPMLLDMRITGRATGKTLVWVIKQLFESREPLDLSDKTGIMKSSDWWCCEVDIYRARSHPYAGWYKNYVKKIYQTLNDKGIQTREVIF